MLGMDAYVSSHLATIKGDNTKVLDSYLLYILIIIQNATDTEYNILFHTNFINWLYVMSNLSVEKIKSNIKMKKTLTKF